MFEQMMQRGKDWVAARMQQLAQHQGVEVTPLGWDADTIDLEAERHLLVVLVSGHRTVIAFDDETLVTVVEEPLSQTIVDGRLRGFLDDQLGDPMGRIA